MVTPDCDQTELGLNAQCCHQKATQRCFYWKKLHCEPTIKDAMGITSQSRMSLNKASNPSLLGEVVHKHQARLCHCMDRWGHSRARAVSTLRAQTWRKISASNSNEGIRRKVHKEVAGGSFRLLQPISDSFSRFSPRVWPNILGLFLKNSSSSRPRQGLRRYG